MICGNNNFHRNGVIGSIYRVINVKIPGFFRRLLGCSLKKKDDERENDGCLGPNGPCKYFIAVFFYLIYTFFAFVYLYSVYPKLGTIYKNVSFHKFYSIFVLPWPWVVFIIFMFIDPGYITPKNVLSYLKLYPHDNALYLPGFCPTDHIPVVPRSRYCRYSKRRVAYVFCRIFGDFRITNTQKI